MRVFYYTSGIDTGFVCRTLDLATYFLPDYTYVQQYRRIPVTGVSPRSDIYAYKGQMLGYDMKEKLLYPLFLAPVRRQTLFTLADSPDYYPSMPYSAQLIGYNGRPVFFYNYQLKRGGRPNYVDSTVFLLVADSNTVIKFGKYPPELRKKAVRYPETYFCTDTADNIYYVHAAYDSVYKTDVSGTISSRNILHAKPVRPPYHPEKEADLAYVRKYKASVEKNCRIAICMNKYIIVLKKMAEPDLLKTPTYKFFVFDTQLKKLYASAVAGEIIPVILPTKDGFLLLGSGYKKIYHYELP